MPATAPELQKAAYEAGKQLLELVKKGITAADIVTLKSFENAIMVHAAISGSTDVYKRQAHPHCQVSTEKQLSLVLIRPNEHRIPVKSPKHPLNPRHPQKPLWQKPAKAVKIVLSTPAHQIKF